MMMYVIGNAPKPAVPGVSCHRAVNDAASKSVKSTLFGLDALTFGVNVLRKVNRFLNGIDKGHVLVHPE